MWSPDEEGWGDSATGKVRLVSSSCLFKLVLPLPASTWVAKSEPESIALGVGVYVEAPYRDSGCYPGLITKRQPIQYTACVGLSLIFQKVTLKETNHPPGLARDWSIYVRPRTNPWRGCGWCPRTAPLIIDIKRCSGTRGLQLCRCKPPPKPAKLQRLLAVARSTGEITAYTFHPIQLMKRG